MVVVLELKVVEVQTKSGLNYIEYLEHMEDVYPSPRSQRDDLIAKETPTNIPVKHLTLLIYSLRTWNLNSLSILRSMTILLNWSMLTDLSDH